MRTRSRSSSRPTSAGVPAGRLVGRTSCARGGGKAAAPRPSTTAQNSGSGAGKSFKRCAPTGSDGHDVAGQGARRGRDQQLAAVRGARPRAPRGGSPGRRSPSPAARRDRRAGPSAPAARRPRAGHACARSPRSAATAARAPAAASANVAMNASPSVRSTNPPSAAIAPPTSAWCSASTAGHAAPSSAASRVDPSMSVNSRAIVPTGGSTTASLPARRASPVGAARGPGARQRFPLSACSRSIASNSALKLPSPKKRAPWRSITSKNSVGRSPTGLVNTCSR